MVVRFFLQKFKFEDCFSVIRACFSKSAAKQLTIQFLVVGDQSGTDTNWCVCVVTKLKRIDLSLKLFFFFLMIEQ